jgi:hypothetical protein
MEHPGLFATEDDEPSTVSETFDILDMWSLVEGVCERLSDDEKKKVKDETGLTDEMIRFRGFDGNHEPKHFGIARFAVEELGPLSPQRGGCIPPLRRFLTRICSLVRGRTDESKRAGCGC